MLLQAPWTQLAVQAAYPKQLAQVQCCVQVTSSAKRRRQPGSTSLAQTPDGSFRDLLLNAADLLRQCGLHVPEVRHPAVTVQAATCNRVQSKLLRFAADCGRPPAPADVYPKVCSEL